MVTRRIELVAPREKKEKTKKERLELKMVLNYPRRNIMSSGTLRPTKELVHGYYLE